MKTGIAALCIGLLYGAALQADSGISIQPVTGEQPAAVQAQVRFVIHVPERLSLTYEAGQLQGDSNGGEILNGPLITSPSDSDEPATTVMVIASP
ncbi:MAG TPA: hypothetical protein PLB10_01505 [Thiolinea sp.]|nr:hypothetical protein [Thiolinea sp.]